MNMLAVPSNSYVPPQAATQPRLEFGPSETDSLLNDPNIREHMDRYGGDPARVHLVPSRDLLENGKAWSEWENPERFVEANLDTPELHLLKDKHFYFWRTSLPIDHSAPAQRFVLKKNCRAIFEGREHHAASMLSFKTTSGLRSNEEEMAEVVKAVVGLLPDNSKSVDTVRRLVTVVRVTRWQHKRWPNMRLDVVRPGEAFVAEPEYAYVVCSAEIDFSSWENLSRTLEGPRKLHADGWVGGLSKVRFALAWDAARGLPLEKMCYEAAFGAKALKDDQAILQEYCATQSTGDAAYQTALYLANDRDDESEDDE